MLNTFFKRFNSEIKAISPYEASGGSMSGTRHLQYFNNIVADNMVCRCDIETLSSYRKKIIDVVNTSSSLDLHGDAAVCGMSMYGPQKEDVEVYSQKLQDLDQISDIIVSCVGNYRQSPK